MAFPDLSAAPAAAPPTTEPPAAAPAASSVNTAAAQAPAQAPPGDPHAAAELTRLRSANAAYAAADEKRAEAERAATQRALVSEGKIDQLLTAHATELKRRDDQLKAQDVRVRQSELTRVLTLALPAGDLVSADAQAQLVSLWAGDFEAVDGPDGAILIRSKTDYRPPGAVVAERLASKSFSHFVRTGNRGGAAAQTTTTDTAHHAAAPVASTGQALSDQMLQARADRIASGSVPRWMGGR